MFSFIGFILIGIFAGWVASKVMKGASSGLLWNLIIGVVGAVLGGWLMKMRINSIHPAMILCIILASLLAIPGCGSDDLVDPEADPDVPSAVSASKRNPRGSAKRPHATKQRPSLSASYMARFV